MKNLNLTTVLLIIPFLFFACNSDDDRPCLNKTVEFKNIENVSSCQNTMWNYTLNSEAAFLVIRNQEEFNQYVNTSGCDPQIDFSQYDLVIGKDYFASPSINFEYSVVDNCEENTIYVIVRAKGAQPVENFETALYHVLIPKLNESQNVKILFTSSS